jgi:hypothetical protein
VRKLGAPDDTENDWSRARPDRKRVLG